MRDVTADVKRLLVEYLWVEEPVQDSARLAEDLGADDLDYVELADAFEDEFGIDITEEELKTLPKVKDVIATIQERVK